MQPVLGLFNLGPSELIVLAVLGVVPLVGAAVVIFVVLRTTRKKDRPDNE